MKPDFQETYLTEIMPLLISMCNDPVPRVASHGFAALTNFVESVEKDIVKDHL